MNRNHLALFHQVAQAGGISLGAQAARISQPAVSRQIAELEGALGVRLLDRLPRGSRLTEAGEILAEYARRWVLIEQTAEAAVADYKHLRQGSLSIGASLTVGGYFLPPVLARFRERHPSVGLSVRIANTGQIEAELLDGTLDVGFTEGPLASAELESKAFYEDELVAVVAPSHPLAGRPKVSAREFCAEPMILREAGSGTRAAIEAALRKKKLPLRPALELASPEGIKNAVVAGLGVAFVSRLVAALDLKSGLLHEVPLSDLSIRRPFHWQRIAGRARSPAHQALMELLGPFREVEGRLAPVR